MNNKKIVFFDGVCNLCNSSVDFIIKRDKKNIFYFAPLQGNTAKKELPENLTVELKTIVLKDQDQVYIKSKAAIHIMKDLGFFYKTLSFFMGFVPQEIGDFFYDLISRKRYSLFGKKDTCRLPTPKEREKFLD